MADARPIAVDLFSGIGGMSLGFEQAGFDVVCAVEFDAAHAAAHRYNFPECEVLEQDAACLTADELEDAVDRGLTLHGRQGDDRQIDVIFGGPPCQGFSVGGLGDPTDPRNELIKHFVRLVIALRPAAFVLENVPAMATRRFPNDKRTVPDWITAQMRRAGYAVARPWILNASCFGVPQDRRRLVLMGVEAALESPRPPMATHAPLPKVPSLSNREKSPGLEIGPSVWDAIGDLPDLDDFDELLSSDSVVLPVDVRDKKEKVASDYARRLAGLAIDPTDLSRPRRRTPSRLTSSLRTVHTEAVISRFANVRPGEREAISRFVRLHPGGLAPTLRAGSTPDRGSFSAPRPIHPKYNRVISVREAARLHGFPDWFRFSAAKWHGFRQVGNSVCPPFGKAIAESMRDALSLSRVAPKKERIALGDQELLTVPSGAGRRPQRSSVPPAERAEASGPQREAA